MEQPLNIIGGGVAGCTAALLAAQAGYKVRLYEPNPLGRGVSGQALGLLVPSTNLVREVDALQRQGCAAWASTLVPLLSQLSGTGITSFYRLWPGGAQLNVPVLFEVFGQALLALGVEIVSETFSHPNPVPPTLWAAGWGNSATATNPTASRTGLACRLAPCGLHSLLVGHGPTQGLYAVPSWDGTTLLGTQKMANTLPTEAPPTPELLASTLQELRQRAGLLYAPLATAQVLESWIGYRPVSTPRLPLVQPLAANTWANSWAIAGLGGVGFALAPIAATAWLKMLPK